MIRFHRSLACLMLGAVLMGCTGPSGSTPAPTGNDETKADDSIAADAQNPLRYIVSPDKPVLDRTQGEWGAIWWVWALGLPADHHPLQDQTGEDCGRGQSGPVFYLGGSFDGHHSFRTCPVPKGKYIYFPILNTECSPIEGPAPIESELRGCANMAQDSSVKATLEIDGVSVPGLEDPVHTAYRNQSQVYGFTLPDNNIEGAFFGVMPPPPAGTVSTLVSAGIYVMLKPLPPGTHTVHFFGAGTDYSVEETYTLEVAER